jgi:phytoene/squalene synthetase
LAALLALQQADGSFGRDDRVIDLIRASGAMAEAWLGEVNAAFTAFVPGVATPPAVVRTVLALLLLSVRFADRQSLWQRAYRKAVRDYLAKALGRTTGEVESWLAGLAKSLASRI